MKMLNMFDLKQQQRGSRNPDRCKDGGACHHACRHGCFREKYCVPLSNSGFDDNWQPLDKSEEEKK